MEKVPKGTSYKSPPMKLVRFFERSRNQWKSKCQGAKSKAKQLKTRIRFLEKSKEQWKRRVRELEDELALMRTKERAREKEFEIVKKNSIDAGGHSSCIEEFTLVPFSHQYSLGHIILFVSLVLSAAASFRCASRCLKIITSFLRFDQPSPSWFSGRLWILRLGYYKLTRTKEKADDWVWIVDHTVQLGAEKCMVILGVRLCSLPAAGNCLSHEDVEPIALFPVKESSGEIVWQQLEDTTEKTGVPRQIIADKGTDLRAGIERFCEEHQQTCSVYDIKHKTAAILKSELCEDESWQEFTQLAARTKKRVQQTSLASLAPPNQRTKSRYMNIETLIRWGNTMLTFLDNQQKEPSKDFDYKQVEEKIGWIPRFRKQLTEWEDLLQIMTITESMVREQGLYHGIHNELKEKLSSVGHTDRTKKVRGKLVAFVAEESFKAKANERLLGSSEVIESVFGKLKFIEKDQAKSGFTGLLLSIGAMVSTTTKETIQKALETVSTKDVLNWCKKNLGKSLQAKRRDVRNFRNIREQKQDQSMMLA